MILIPRGTSHGMARKVVLAALFCTAGGAAMAAPVAVSGYTLTPFATAPAGSSAPDSITIVGNDVYVGYGNGGDPTGAGGAVSTIAEYSLGGTLLNSTSVVGHNDGLRYDATSGQIWALQNEDANANLVLMTPGTLVKSAPYVFTPAAHGGGYDDVAFRGGSAFISASNPTINPNTAPAIVSATLAPGQVNVTGILAGNATAHVINTGTTTTLNLQDPDSLIFAPDGRLVLDSQGDSQLVFVTDPGGAGQSAAVLNLSNQVDDTVFSGSGQSTLLFAAKGTNTVYRLTGDFAPGTAFSAAASSSGVSGTDFIGQLNLATGDLTPIVTGLSSPGGEAFLPVAVPEPAGIAALGVAALMLLGLKRRRLRG